MALSARYSKASDTFDSSISADWENGGGDWATMSWERGGYVGPTTASTDAMLRRQTETFGDNQYSKVSLNALSSSGTASNTIVPVRLAAGTDESCYLGCMFHMTSSTEARYEIFEATAAFGFTSHTSGGSRGDSWSAGDYGVMEASGTSLELYTKEGAGSETSRLTWTDGTITSGKPG